MDERGGWLAFVKTQETNTTDEFGHRTFNATKAIIQKSEGDFPEELTQAGWLPNYATAKEWQSFVRQQEHPILPLH
jgi:hypothetical protein